LTYPNYLIGLDVKRCLRYNKTLEEHTNENVSCGGIKDAFLEAKKRYAV
jgi:hypothetical protein